MTSERAEQQSIWARVAALEAKERGTALKQRHARRFRWVVDAIMPLALTITASVGVMLPPSLPTQARWSLWAFTFAVILWSTTRINAAYVGLAAVLVLVVAGGAPQEKLFDALASDVIWLMIGAFVLGGAVQKTGLAHRLTGAVVERAHTVRGTFWLLTTALIPLTFLIPSTSGRASVVLPVFHSIADAADDQRITRALALLMPTIILVATVSTLIGAGSHLVANDLLHQIAEQRISFTQWAIYGLPFGIAASYISCWTVLKLFLDPGRRGRELKMQVGAKRKPLSIAEWKTLAVAGVMVFLWVSESGHGLEIATVAVASALALTLPGFGVLGWKDGLKSVSWNLIVFVGAALALGRSLIDSGAARWIIDSLFALSGIARTNSTLIALLTLAFISLTSHIYMTSHTARAAALIPGMLYLAASLELNPVAVLFISTVGMDYCLTFPVSSKALLMFQELETETYQPSDLLRLSAVLLIVHLVLMVAFYYGYWRWIGLEL
jgi:anion transporter